MSSEQLNFDLTPIEAPCTLGGRKYLLREAGTADTAAYRANSERDNVVVEQDGKHQVKIGEAWYSREQDLVGRCLFPLKEDGSSNGQPVGTEFVRGLPGRVTDALFKRVKEMSEHLRDRPETVADIDKQIADLTRRKAELLRAGGDSAPKSPPSAGTAG